MSPPDYGLAFHERAEIYDLVRDEKITGFAIVSGDRHSFWAGYATSQLPPGTFEPVGLSFVGASLSSAGTMEAEFVCIPRPVTRSDRPDGGPLRYRVVHSATLWAAGERPKLTQEILEGDVGLSI